MAEGEINGEDIGGLGLDSHAATTRVLGGLPAWVPTSASAGPGHCPPGLPAAARRCGASAGPRCVVGRTQ